MVALGAWQLAGYTPHMSGIRRVILTATLVVTLDLQIETIATLVNPYWYWVDSGPYYGVPTLNFIGWWFVGLAMALLLRAILPVQPPTIPVHGPRWARQIFLNTPVMLYLFSTIMFTVVNLSRGYWLAGVVGLIVLAIMALIAVLDRGWMTAALAVGPVGHRTSD
jgi:putative membrane protein